MRKLLAAFCLSAALSPALAQDAAIESITAHGNSLVGVWRIGRPDSIAMTGFFSPIVWGPERQHFCRIAPSKDELAMFCGGGVGTWTVTAEDNHVHFAWGTMLLRLVLDGELQDIGHFRGRFQFKVTGITAESPSSYDAVKITPDPDAPDGGGASEILRRVLEQGLAGTPHDDTRYKDGLPQPPRLGAVSAIAYVGQEERELAPRERGGSPRPYGFSVYLVSFAEGQRLCGLHQRDDGVLDDFGCA